MQRILEDYKIYYQTRAKRYLYHPHFQRLAQAEQNLSDAMASCEDLNHPPTGFQELAQATGIAQALDMASYKAQFYSSIDENVLADGYQELFDYIQEQTHSIAPMELMGIHAEKEQVINLKFGEDQLHRIHFLKILSKLEEIEIYENAKASSRYESELHELAKTLKKDILDSLEWERIEARKYYPEFNFNWNILWEKRHRKHISLPDLVLEKRIQQLKNLQ